MQVTTSQWTVIDGAALDWKKSLLESLNDLLFLLSLFLLLYNTHMEVKYVDNFNDGIDYDEEEWRMCAKEKWVIVAKWNSLLIFNNKKRLWGSN